MIRDQEVADWLLNKIITKAHEQGIDWANNSSYFFKEYASDNLRVYKTESCKDKNNEMQYIENVGPYYDAYIEIRSENKTIKQLNHVKDLSMGICGYD